MRPGNNWCSRHTVDPWPSCGRPRGSAAFVVMVSGRRAGSFARLAGCGTTAPAPALTAPPEPGPAGRNKAVAGRGPRPGRRSRAKSRPRRRVLCPVSAGGRPRPARTNLSGRSPGRRPDGPPPGRAPRRTPARPATVLLASTGDNSTPSAPAPPAARAAQPQAPDSGRRERSTTQDESAQGTANRSPAPATSCRRPTKRLTSAGRSPARRPREVLIVTAVMVSSADEGSGSPSAPRPRRRTQAMSPRRRECPLVKKPQQVLTWS